MTNRQSRFSRLRRRYPNTETSWRSEKRYVRTPTLTHALTTNNNTHRERKSSRFIPISAENTENCWKISKIEANDFWERSWTRSRLRSPKKTNSEIAYVEQHINVSIQLQRVLQRTKRSRRQLQMIMFKIKIDFKTSSLRRNLKFISKTRSRTEETRYSNHYCERNPILL